MAPNRFCGSENQVGFTTSHKIATCRRGMITAMWHIVFCPAKDLLTRFSVCPVPCRGRATSWPCTTCVDTVGAYVFETLAQQQTKHQ
eukprot:1518588-Amphidinium_carterae.1